MVFAIEEVLPLIERVGAPFGLLVITTLAIIWVMRQLMGRFAAQMKAHELVLKRIAVFLRRQESHARSQRRVMDARWGQFYLWSEHMNSSVGDVVETAVLKAMKQYASQNGQAKEKAPHSYHSASLAESQVPGV